MLSSKGGRETPIGHLQTGYQMGKRGRDVVERIRFRGQSRHGITHRYEVPRRLVALHGFFGGSLQESEYFAEILCREFLVHYNTLRSRPGRRLLHQGLAMTSHTSALLEDYGSGGQQKANGAAQGSVCVQDTSRLRSWIGFLPRTFTAHGSKLSKHIDLALVGFGRVCDLEQAVCGVSGCHSDVAFVLRESGRFLSLVPLSRTWSPVSKTLSRVST